MSTLSKNIKYLRKILDVMQSELASALSLRQTTISNWENGVSVPNAEDLVKFYHFFGISIDILLLEDIEKGKLITNEDVANFKAKGKLNGKLIGKLIGKKAPIYGEGSYEQSEVKEHEELTMWVVLKELRQMSQKIDVMGVSVAEIAQNTAPKKR